jgi:hypothetical protein
VWIYGEVGRSHLFRIVDTDGSMGSIAGIALGAALIAVFLVVGIFRYAAFFPGFGRWLVRTFPRYGHLFVDEPGEGENSE